MTFTFERDEIKAAPQEMQNLFAYWNKLSGERFAPTLKDFDLPEIPSDLLPNSIIVDYIAADDTFKYRFFGTEASSRHGQDMTGLSPLDSHMKPFGEALDQEYRAFMKRKQPEYLSFQHLNQFGANELHKVLRLPLSDDGKAISGIVVILIACDDEEENLKVFAKE
jgi:hypothetical protein